MLHSTIQTCRLLLTVLLCACLFSQVDAQVDRRDRSSRATDSAGARPKIKETDVRFELIREPGTDGVAAQRWGRLFQKLGITLRIRNPLINDKGEIKESMLGRIRQVKAIGVLRADGTIAFPGRSYSTGDAGRLKEWIDELKTYGAQGAPAGKPAFGLDQRQFALLTTSLSQVVEGETEELGLAEALDQLALPSEYPVRLTEDAKAWLAVVSSRKVGSELKGFSKGTALAVVLNEFGLGFRPLRTPDGSLQLTIAPLKKQPERWPVGWELEQLKLKRTRVAPKLFKMVPVDLKDVPLKDVLDGVTIASGVPVLIDYYKIEAMGIDVRKLLVSHPPKRTSWSLVLKGITNPHKLTRKVLVDERNRAFVWVTLLVTKRAK